MKTENKKVTTLICTLCFIILAALVIFTVLPACTGDGTQTDAPTSGETVPGTDSSVIDAPDGTEPATQTDEPGDETQTDAPQSENPSETSPDDATGDLPESDTETAGEEPAETETQDPAVTVNFAIDSNMWSKCFSSPNQCKYELVQDETLGCQVLKLTVTKDNAGDPFVSFDYSNYCVRIAKSKALSADDYKYVAIKLRCEGITSANFELFYNSAKGSSTPSANNSKLVAFDNSDEGWQYILFDLSNAVWAGKINGFRLDFVTSAQSGESMYIAEIRLFKSSDEFYAMLGYTPGEDDEGYSETPEQKELVDRLLSVKDASDSTAYAKYTPVKTEKDDADLSLTFHNVTDRTAKDDNAHAATGTPSYQIRMAKNEIEGVSAVLAAAKDRSGLKVYVTDFTNSDGVTLTTDLLWGYYFDVDGQTIVDVLPPVVYAEDLKEGDLDWNNAGNHAGAYIPNYQKYNGFDIPAGTNQTFIVKAHTEADSPAGEYRATFTVRDKDGNTVKEADIFVYVWNFALPEKTSCRTLADISWFAVYANHKCYNGDNGYLYQLYYDYMLENRICGYDIPYNDNNGTFSDERVYPYLDNPRVTAFQAIGWKTDLTDGKISRAYATLSAKQEWLDKAYFYPIDEPNTAIDPQILNKINDFGKMLAENFPGYKLIVPMHLNTSVSGGDYFSYISDYVTAWCPHTFFFNTFDEYLGNRKLTYRMSRSLEKKFGTFTERMAAEQAGGDEVWWYVTRFPQDPEITLTMNTNAINYRILFWQQKLYNVDGFLYYSVTDWFDSADFAPTIDDFPGYDGPISGDGAPTVARPIGLNSKHETDSSYPFNVYGNGVLVYVGQNFGVYGPVGCYRLECVRDGIEDYEYLTLLTELYGKDTADLVIKRITTSLSVYTDDESYFNSVRNAVGSLLDSELGKKN